MKILVTGGAGFIGSHLVDALVSRGDQVRILDSLEPQVHRGKKPSTLNPKAEYLFGNVADASLLVPAVAGVEAIVHLAATVGVGQSMYEVAHYMENNTQTTAKLLQYLVENPIPLKKLVVASSMSIYGEGLYRCSSHGPLSPSLRPLEQLAKHQWEMLCPQCGKELQPLPTPENKPIIPTSVYAISKRDQEELCLVVGEAYHFPAVALRFFNVYGPRQALSNPYTGACAIFSARIKNGKAPVLYEDGKQSRDFIHVSDLVQGILIGLDHPKVQGEVFNIGTGKPSTILQVAQGLAKAYGSAMTPTVVSKYRAGDIRHCYADISKISAFGFKPKFTLEEGLRDLVRWGSSAQAEDHFESAQQELIKRGLLTN